MLTLFVVYILISTQKRIRRATDTVFKRPEGMHRELYALLYSDQRCALFVNFLVIFKCHKILFLE